MKRQQIDNKRGEITFRRKLYRQQVLGEEIFEDEYDASEIEGVLRRRMADTVQTIGELRSSGIVVSPYLEVGAERGQRALALENELGGEGAALDLSLDLLRSCEHYRRRFGLSRGPIRICGDAYRLPFVSGSVPFVFCYQTLHHFPDPSPIVAEIHRILMPGGHFFFAEEPYRRRLRWKLYAVRRGARGSPGRGPILRFLDRMFAEEVVNEETFGVIENHDLTVDEWRRSLAPFQEVRLTLRTARVFEVDPDRSWNPATRIAAHLLGGLVSGLGRKAGVFDSGRVRPIESVLASPLGLARGVEAPLERIGDYWKGPEAGDVYPVEDGVAVLLDPDLRRELYPATGS